MKPMKTTISPSENEITVLEREIYAVMPFMKDLLFNAECQIRKMRENELEVREKGKFVNGGIDYVTRVDLEIGNLYRQEIQKEFPRWGLFIEDITEALEDQSKILFMADPVDGTSLLKNGQLGYSTMISLSRISPQGYVPVLGRCVDISWR